MKILPYCILLCYVVCATAVGGMIYVDRQSPNATSVALHMVVATPSYEAATSRISPYGPGYDRELLQEFCKSYGYTASFVTAQSREEALYMLSSGKADLAMGFGGDVLPPVGIMPSPAYYHAKRITARLPAPHAATDTAPATVQGSPLYAHTDDATGIRYWIDRRSWSLWEPFAPLSKDVEWEGVGDERESYHWFWRVHNPSLQFALTRFWENLLQPHNTLLAELEELYYGFLPSKSDPNTAVDMVSMVQHRLPRYRDMLTRASRKAGLDPMLFTAVVMQESRLDESTVSHTGVRGIMQLTTDTAAYLRVDRMNPAAALEAGARYLHMLWERLEPLGLNDWDRWFFTLAAFNQGPRRLEGAIALSQKLGGTGRTWAELKKVYPLLSQKKYADMVGQGTCRGQEAVTFVARVRWSYHFLHGLITLHRPEAQNLTPRLGSIDFRTVRRSTL